MTLSNTRQLAQDLRDRPDTIDRLTVVEAAAAIDTLLDVIELQRGPAVVKPAPDLSPLRTLRQWHSTMANASTPDTPAHRGHYEAVQILNQYFTDKL